MRYRNWTIGLLIASLAAAQQLAERGKVLPLTLKQAVDLALAPEGSVRVQLAEELIRQARARAAQSRAALLPNVDSSIGQQSQTRNLAAFGIRIESPIPGLRIPEFVGPFNTFDVRATASQNILDLSAIRRFQASRVGISAAELDAESRRDQTAAEVSKLYLAAQRAEADLEASKANVELAEALRKLALDRKNAGTGTGIEVTRADVQLANERQRLLVTQDDRRRSHLELLKAIGLRLDTTLELTDKLAYKPVEILPVEQAVKIALETRADLKAQKRREETARLNHSATKLERVPALAGFADYGSIGSSINNAVPTRTFGLSLRVPVFDGGRRDARRSESLSQLHQERLRSSDLRDQVELEIRLALDSLRSATEELKVAEEGMTLAENELAQAQRRYQAGVTSSVEVTDAQTRLERARQNRIAALVSHNIAALDLSQAMGTIRSTIQ